LNYINVYAEVQSMLLGVITRVNMIPFPGFLSWLLACHLFFRFISSDFMPFTALSWYAHSVMD